MRYTYASYYLVIKFLFWWFLGYILVKRNIRYSNKNAFMERYLENFGVNLFGYYFSIGAKIVFMLFLFTNSQRNMSVRFCATFFSSKLVMIHEWTISDRIVCPQLFGFCHFFYLCISIWVPVRPADNRKFSYFFHKNQKLFCSSEIIIIIN